MFVSFSVWPDYVRARIRDTYLYLGASCGVVAGSAIAVFQSPMGQRLAAFTQRHPIMVQYKDWTQIHAITTVYVHHLATNPCELLSVSTGYGWNDCSPHWLRHSHDVYALY